MALKFSPSRKKRSKIVIAGVTIVVVIALHFIGWLKPLENVVIFVTRPLFEGTGSITRSIQESASLLGSIGDLASENKDLSVRIEELEAENAKLVEVERENSALREQLNFSERGEYELEPSLVVGYDPTSFTEYLTIDKGSESGIEVNDPVITQSGVLIGKIEEVGWRNAKVLLISDSTQSVNAVVQDSRATGIIRGELGLGLVMELIPQDEVIKIGDRVVTSGLGGNYPKGLAIGEVEDVSQAKNELFQTARVKPFASLRDVEIAFVIKSF